MANVVIGVFPDSDRAKLAIDQLEEAGYNPKEISILMKGEEGEIRHEHGPEDVAEGAASGAITGGIIGGLAGLLVGVGIIPGLGALLIGGPLAAALGLTGAAAATVSGAATGVIAGGVIGALANLGVPEEEARVYEEKIKSGGVLLAVPVKANEEDKVVDILEANDAGDVKSFTA